MSANSGEAAAAIERLLAPSRPLLAALPVLRATAEDLARLRQLEERAASGALSAVVLRDPLLSLRVLRFLTDHRTRSQSADITTIGHAIIMLGQARFLREFAALPVLEEVAPPQRLAAMREVASRARLASLLARDFAVQRHDIEPEELMLAALLHEVPAMLAALSGTPPAGEADATDTLRAQLLAAVGTPELLARLNGPDEGHDPRIGAVGIACRIAQACGWPWRGDAIDCELERLQRFLRISRSQAWERVRKALLQAASDWRRYATPPALRHLPFIVE